MNLAGLKFKQGDFTGKDITSLPDRPWDSGITGAELKARFDSIPKMMIALGNFNLLMDEFENEHLEKAIKSDGVRFLRLNADKAIETSTDNLAWEQVASSGHLVVDKNGAFAPQRTKLKFSDCTFRDTGTETIIYGVGGGVDTYTRAEIDEKNALNANSAKPFTATLSAANWSAAPPFTQTVNVLGMTADGVPFVDKTTFTEAQAEEYNKINGGVVTAAAMEETDIQEIHTLGELGKLLKPSHLKVM